MCQTEDVMQSISIRAGVLLITCCHNGWKLDANDLFAVVLRAQCNKSYQYYKFFPVNSVLKMAFRQENKNICHLGDVENFSVCISFIG